MTIMLSYMHMRSLFSRLLLPAVLLFVSLEIFFSHLRHIDNRVRPVFEPNQESKVDDHPAIEVETPTESHVDRSCDFATTALTLKGDLRRTIYSRAVFRPRFVESQQPSLSLVDRTVLTPFETRESGFQLGSLPSKDGCANIPVAEVDVEQDPSQLPTKGILLGMTKPLDRLEMRLEEISYYLLTSKASLLVIVPETVGIATAQRKYRARGLDITLVPSIVEPFQLRYFSMIRELSSYIRVRRPETEWVATVDDDTFFPQLLYLGDRLAALNSTDYHWIGTRSESSLNVKNFGDFSYGGSGILLSRGLLERLDANYDACMGPHLGPPDFGGDHRITKCIRTVEPHIQMEHWKELRQWDLRGSPAGIFESGKPIWTYHHWGETGWFNTDVLSICGTAIIAGQKSILQRFMFNREGGYDESQHRSYYILTNGYSIVHYDLDPGVADINFDETEYTWADEPEDYEDALGSFRNVTVKGITKKRWLLEGVIRVGNNIHQRYMYEVQEDEEEENNVIEVIWLGPGS